MTDAPLPATEPHQRLQRAAGRAWGLLALLLSLLLSWPAAAQQVPPRPDPPKLVNDLAGLLQPDQVQALEQKLVNYSDSTSSQISVVTVPTLDNSDIFSYSQKLFQDWGIGQKDKDNGILILVAVQERQARIQTGSGMEGAVPDALAKRIINYRLIPAFRQQAYYQGIDQATDDLFALLKGEYKAPPEQAQGSRDGSGSGWGFWLIIGVLLLVFLFRSRGGGGRGGRGGIGGGFVPPIIFGDFSGSRGVFGGGGGGFGGGGGGGGFGGFGGGSSGGGGASGSW